MHGLANNPRTAEALGARLPPLLVAAERVAATVAQGVHGRRRVGQGDSFWQFRPFVSGDARARIDWRQSAKSDRAFVRETEWEAAQTVCLWRDGGASMRWRSSGETVEKRARAELLLLALASLLLRGAERVQLFGAAPTAGAGALDRIARTLDDERANADAGSGLPPNVPLPRHARAVLFGDFLAPIEQVAAMIGRLAAVPVRGHLVQVLDPAEVLLPYDGRVKFEAAMDAGRHSDGPSALIARVGSVRAAYQDRLARHQDALAAAATAAGFGYTIHRTDASPATALLGLSVALMEAGPSPAASFAGWTGR